MENSHLNKIPAITLVFWIMKISATTLGETGGDLIAQTMNVGYGTSSVILIGFFLAALTIQFFTKKYHPAIYWLVIVATSTAGTTMSDYMDRTLGVGYAAGSLILVGILLSILVFWRFSVGSLSVENIKTFRVELLYWLAILTSNTLGTALGDYLADDSGLGFGGGAAVITSLLVIVILLHYYSGISKVALFWIAFVLTRPFGATFGDLLTKSAEAGGYDLGTIGASLILAVLLIAFVIYTSVQEYRVDTDFSIQDA
ncbi:MAG: hypothetical protein KDB79_10255 [Acidobacteria bacterium]|nr:hypothetical protein [Acidobacteriota bacterium]